MKLLKSYCGLSLLRYNGLYMCIDKYEEKIRCSGTYEECKKYFDNFVDYIAERR